MDGQRVECPAEMSPAKRVGLILLASAFAAAVFVESSGTVLLPEITEIIRNDAYRQATERQLLRDGVKIILWLMGIIACCAVLWVIFRRQQKREEHDA